MTEAAEKYYILEEYLAFEEKSGQKNEYYQGQLYQIAGGSARHNLIASNINAILNSGLVDYPCLVFSGDMRILVEEHHLYTYADGSVVCGEVEFAHNREDTVTNPILLVEVLSKSTRNYDRGDKFELYRAIEALQYYLIVDQERVFVEFHRKLEDGNWQLETLTSLDQSLKLPELGNLELNLARIYSKVTFPPRPVRRLRQELIPHPNPAE
ncbi:MAG TPA: Uma2 family endonuclease [Chloroflexia bacterium]|nr:Uma2 family endonuclease [Chloroflexia bacterium]